MHFAHDNFPVSILHLVFMYITVNAKVHGLKEIFNRLDRRTYPLPTGNDVANYLKWFQQTLQRYRENFTLASTTMQGLISERFVQLHLTPLGEGQQPDSQSSWKSSLHLYHQLLRIIQGSTKYRPNLLVSHMAQQMSQI